MNTSVGVLHLPVTALLLVHKAFTLVFLSGRNSFSFFWNPQTVTISLQLILKDRNNSCTCFIIFNWNEIFLVEKCNNIHYFHGHLWILNFPVKIHCILWILICLISALQFEIQLTETNLLSQLKKTYKGHLISVSSKLEAGKKIFFYPFVKTSGEKNWFLLLGTRNLYSTSPFLIYLSSL